MRTDENGKGLQAVLGYLLDRAVPAKEIYDALGIARNTYHNRIDEDSFPNAEELRLIADSFGLNPVDLMLRFGLITEGHLEPFLAPVKTARKATPRRTLKSLQDMPRNPDVAPL